MRRTRTSALARNILHSWERGFPGKFGEVREALLPIFQECARTGRSVRKENDMLAIERDAEFGPQETWFSWSFTPLYGGTGRILGFYNAPFEITQQTISSRRMQMLHFLGVKVARVRAVKPFWRAVLSGLEENPFDIPFALLYSISDSDDADSESLSSGSSTGLKACFLEGSIGIPDGHPASPLKFNLRRSTEGFIPAYREAMRTREPTQLRTSDGTLPETLLEGFDWRGWGEPCREATIIPIRPTNGENVFAFLLIGVNSRRPYDDDYKAFTSILDRQLATSLASVLLSEDEVRRRTNAVEMAALQREQLTQQLELQKSRLQRMTEFSSLGMFLFSPNGVLLEANERYYQMMGHPRDASYEWSFIEHLAEESQQAAKTMWDDMVADHKPRSKEFKIKGVDTGKHALIGGPIEYWVLASSTPEIDIEGELRSIMGSIADISHIKWGQGLQERQLQEAEEQKRQQNDFIDMVSHEMRNPLSAILICADDIRDTLRQQQKYSDHAAVIENCIEAADTIALCAQHQKAIVDDILTVSKLNSNLLTITPIPTQPAAIIQRAMSMFKPELQAKDIAMNFLPHPSLQEHGVDWVMLDPSRLLQITVNLITNAIKFTQSEKLTREISVYIGASVGPLNVQTQGFHYIPIRNEGVHVTDNADFGFGDVIQIHVKVQDTGCGLTGEEMDRLFERFMQASPRTHTVYGGSGLGLFISRHLAELHGGQIGVASEAGVGSTFGFYIQTKRTVTPPNAPQQRRSNAEHSSDVGSKTNNVQEIQSLANTETSIHLARETSRIDPRQFHILVVEDNLVNQKVLKKQLHKAGCIVATADNGLYALSHLETTMFCKKERGIPLSVVLMDLEMPEMDGLACVGRIREMEADGRIAGHVPVIAVTANARTEQIKTAIDNGMDDVVSKPFRVPELLAKIEELLGRLGGG